MVTSIYPVLMSDRVAETAEFFRSAFGCEVTFESDWYVSLRAGAWELAVLDGSHPTVPPAFRGTARGVLVNVEGRRVALDLRSEEFGQRHFILVAPGDVLVDVIQPIPFTGAYEGLDAPAQPAPVAQRPARRAQPAS
ncbi:glyoxalase [Cellulomonas sp. NS3]|uniref:glyoxalase n=1 Tax=Cellulomonas sp. NS3 TaxID=2973977 RepID=UPI0021615482|nr:glyoxalase [Cellulomonas sp. NS3]